MSQAYDVIIIGAGPGGYTCAIRAAQLGLKTAIIEKTKLGGTCLNVGCIPAKSLLESSKYFDLASNKLQDHGIKVKPSLDLKTMLGRKDQVVKGLTDGVAYLMKKNKVTVFEGLGKIQSPTEVMVNKKSLSCKNIVIATGSKPRQLNGLEFDGQQVISSTEALALKEVPKKLAIVGAGVIGLEMGSVWARLGAEVHLIEHGSQVGGPLDQEVSKKLLAYLKKQGLSFTLSTEVTGLTKNKKSVSLHLKDRASEKESKLEANLVLVAAGRQPVTEGLGLENIGVTTEKAGQVPINSSFQVEGFPNIYSIGDATYGPMLAHKAEEEGVAVAEIISGQQSQVNYGLIPSVIYTHPEASSVGFTEEELKAEGVSYIKGNFPFAASGRAKTLGDESGFVKVLCHKETHKILGVHILGYKSSEFLSEAIVAMKAGLTAEQLSHTCHSHPSLSEAIREAALAALGRARQC